MLAMVHEFSMGTLTFKFGLFTLTNPPDIPEGWTTRGRSFVTANTGQAWKYIGLADEIARKRLAPIAKKIQAELEASFTVNAPADYDIPTPPGMVPRPYQAAGVHYTEDRDDVLNADAPRLGKTVQANCQMNRLSKQWRKPKLHAVIFTPAIAKEHWRREVTAWQTHGSPVKKIIGRKDTFIDGINIINWDLVPDYGRELRDRVFDFATFDEAHALSNFGSQRSKILLGEDGKGPRLQARKRLFLTGTPIFTKPFNIFPLVRTCDPYGIGSSEYQFGERYCDALNNEHGRFIPAGGSNLEELQVRLRRKFMVRREKADVVKEIPSVRERVVFDGAEFTALLHQEESTIRAAFQDDRRSLADIVADIADGRAAHEFAPDGIGSSYEALSLAKVPHVTAFVQELLETRPTEKFIIFAHHRSVVSAYAAAFPEGVCIIGGMGDTARQAAIDRFRVDASARVAVVSIMAAGAAISLAAADTAVYAELVRSPGAMMQSEERFWLVEKTNPCTVYWTVVDGSADDIFIDVLEERRDMIARVTDRGRMLGPQ